MLYASWGRGAESDVVPNRSQYVNAGQALPTLLSQQFELGLKGARDNTTWSVAAFDITRPVFADIRGQLRRAGACTVLRQAGRQRAPHRHRSRRHAAQRRVVAGRRPAVAQGAARRQPDGCRQRPASGQRAGARRSRPSCATPCRPFPAWQLGADVAAESDRTMLPDDTSLQIPGYADRRSERLSGCSEPATSPSPGAPASTTCSIDKRWKEAPYQFGHVYLFPLPGRTARASVQAAW